MILTFPILLFLLYSYKNTGTACIVNFRHLAQLETQAIYLGSYFSYPQSTEHFRGPGNNLVPKASHGGMPTWVTKTLLSTLFLSHRNSSTYHTRDKTINPYWKYEINTSLHEWSQTRNTNNPTVIPHGGMYRSHLSNKDLLFYPGVWSVELLRYGYFSWWAVRVDTRRAMQCCFISLGLVELNVGLCIFLLPCFCDCML